jgi:hypothetical protein
VTFESGFQQVHQESKIVKCFRKCGLGQNEIISKNSTEYSESDNINNNKPLTAIKTTCESFWMRVQ